MRLQLIVPFPSRATSGSCGAALTAFSVSSNRRCASFFARRCCSAFLSASLHADSRARDSAATSVCRKKDRQTIVEAVRRRAAKDRRA